MPIRIKWGTHWRAMATACGTAERGLGLHALASEEHRHRLGGVVIIVNYQNPG
jgi:hypothetical protein